MKQRMGWACIRALRVLADKACMHVCRATEAVGDEYEADGVKAYDDGDAPIGADE